jgi:hypothetical protein
MIIRNAIIIRGNATIKSAYSEGKTGLVGQKRALNQARQR